MKLTNYIKELAADLRDELRINHDDCPAGNDTKQRLWLKGVDDGVVCYCHNCGERGFIKMRHTSSLFDGIQIGKIYIDEEPRKVDNNPLHIRDYTTDISKEGLLWLFKYDITLEEIKGFKIGYSPAMNRLILPVYRDSKLVYWQGRALEASQKPKYLNPKGVQPVPFNRATTGSQLGSKRVVIVEDIISAIKVGRVMNTYAILGSKISKELWDRIILLELAQVNVWLDKDKEQFSRKLCRNLELYTHTIPIVTDKDPKEYNTEEIKQILGV